MVGEDNEIVVLSHGNSLEDLFPGYYPASQEERQEAYRQGLVSLDANALLDLYRFSAQARNEFFEVLEKLRPRLFITHQAACEFYRNRLSVVESRFNAVEEKCQEIDQSLRTVTEKIQEFANRHQIDDGERQRLVKLVGDLSSSLSDSIRAAGAYDLTRKEVRDATDAVLKRLQTLLADRVGDALGDADYRNAIKDALRRREERVPPGYAEKKGSPELQAGDYLLWRELMNEALVHERAVLFVTNEQKEDWILKGPAGQVLGPRPELVLEMKREAKVPFHMVTVVGLLKEAPEYLGTKVSQSTILEAESIPYKRRVDVQLTAAALKQFRLLSGYEQGRVTAVIEKVRDRIKKGKFLRIW